MIIFANICLWLAIAANIYSCFRNLGAMREIQKLKHMYWQKGVVEGSAATQFPGDPHWKEARELLDKIAADAMFSALEKERKET
jgi:hypothetical protein